MFADMTQPCHVRNDSHPDVNLDPLESYATSAHVKAYATYPVDTRSKINESNNAEVLFENLARFTNQNFYTYDTIFDNVTGVMPRNGEAPMPHPQFSDLKLGKDGITYLGDFNGKPVPLVQQTYASSKLGSLWRNYVVPPSFSDNLSEVLLPIAVEADAKLINFFFPTMELTINVSELNDIEKGSDSSYKEYLVDGKMKHQTGDDKEWARNGLEIQYSGPVELWCDREGKALHIGDTKFKSGSIDEILHVYTGEAPRQTNAEKIKKYQVENGDNLYFVIKAGGRRFVSKPYKFAAESQISIDPSKLDGEPGKEYTFTGKVVNPPDKPSYDWYIDGKKIQSGPKTIFSTKFPAANRYEVSVQCLDETGKVLCDDSVTANIIKDEVQKEYREPIYFQDTTGNDTYYWRVTFYDAKGQYGHEWSEGMGSSSELCNFVAGHYSAKIEYTRPAYTKDPAKWKKATLEFNIPQDIKSKGLILVVPQY
jgi:hypothetical protein